MLSIHLIPLLFAAVCMNGNGLGEGRTEGAIVVNNGILTMYGTPIDSVWGSNGFHQALGKPSPDDDETDRKENYDTKGIVVWKEGDDFEEVTELLVQFAYDPDETWYKSTTYYSGPVYIEGILVTAHTSLEELKSSLPQYNWKKSSTGWYEGIYKNIFMYVCYDKEEKNILWIDFGLDDENTWY